MYIVLVAPSFSPVVSLVRNHIRNIPYTCFVTDFCVFGIDIILPIADEVAFIDIFVLERKLIFRIELFLSNEF